MTLLTWVSDRLLGLAARCAGSLEPDIAAVGRPGRPPQWLAWPAAITPPSITARNGALPRLINQDRSHISQHHLSLAREL